MYLAQVCLSKNAHIITKIEQKYPYNYQNGAKMPHAFNKHYRHQLFQSYQSIIRVNKICKLTMNFVSKFIHQCEVFSQKCPYSDQNGFLNVYALHYTCEVFFSKTAHTVTNSHGNKFGYKTKTYTAIPTICVHHLL